MSQVLNRGWAIALIALLCAVPLLVPSFPPLTDLGGHLGRYAVQVDRGASADIGQWYGFQWFLLPNLGVDLLVEILARFTSLETAVKAILSASTSLWALGLLLLSREVHGRVQPTALFALPLIYTLPLHYGFANFHLAIGFVLLASTLWIRLGRTGRIGLRSALFVPIGMAIWLCHLVGWAVFGVIAFADCLAREHESGKAWWLALLRAGTAMLPLLAGPLAGLAFGPSSGPVNAFTYEDFGRKLEWLAIVFADRWMVWDKVSFVVLMLALGWFWRSADFVRHRGLALAAVLLAAIYAVMPSTIMDSRYADMRLVPVALVLFAIAAAPAPRAAPRLMRQVAIAGLLFAGVRLCGNTVAMASHDAQFRQSLAVLDHVQKGTNLVTFHVQQCGVPKPWDVDRRLHLSGFALARRHTFDNHQWEMASGQLLTVDNPAARPFEREPSPAIYDRPCGAGAGLADAFAAVGPAIGMVWVIGMPPGFRADGWAVIRVSGDSAILKRQN